MLFFAGGIPLEWKLPKLFLLVILIFKSELQTKKKEFVLYKIELSIT